jgi:hypothetical protein
MRQSITLKQQLNTAIDSEIAQRVVLHKATIARVKTARAAMATAGEVASPEPLVMLAQGDSWFDYPLNGNTLSPFTTTDIIAQLTGMGTINPVIANLAHFGEASTDEMGLPKQERMIAMLRDNANWLGRGKPDAILLSAGGNDIVGNQFCIFVGYATAGELGLVEARFQEALGMVKASYQDMIAFRDLYAPAVPIFAHCYDFPLPTGTPAGCLGPWLKPSLDYAGWNFAQGSAICRQALVDFKTMLQGLAADPANLFFLVDTQGVLDAADWANELHPFPPGFSKLAGKFLDALRAFFPGRI